MARTDEQGNIVPSPGQVFGDPIPRGFPKLEDIENDDLIYADVTRYTEQEYLDELARVLRVQGENVTTGVDLTYWYDRENHIREMRDMAFPRHAKGTV